MSDKTFSFSQTNFSFKCATDVMLEHTNVKFALYKYIHAVNFNTYLSSYLCSQYFTVLNGPFNSVHNSLSVYKI